MRENILILSDEALYEAKNLLSQLEEEFERWEEFFQEQDLK